MLSVNIVVSRATELIAVTSAVKPVLLSEDLRASADLLAQLESRVGRLR